MIFVGSVEVQWKCCGAVEVQWTCRVDVQRKCSGGGGESAVEVKSALRASLCGGSPRVKDPATLFIE